MNGRKLMQLCIGSSGSACNKRLGTHTHLWSSCWHAALLYRTILLDSQLSSGTYAAAWILHLHSFTQNTTHSQGKVAQLSFVHGVQVGVQRFYVGVPSDSRNFISAISKLIQLSDKKFYGAYGLSLICCFLQSMFLQQWIAWSCQSFLDRSFVLCTKSWILACSWLQGTVDCSL